ncbi:MAG: carboxypeptidase-like regulatory domain-containing protein, partial [Prevotellaceae bacterium]|nr:carboxypeptidase-like regulatory domain-containing protein [Prevotellaceae bacterium]
MKRILSTTAMVACMISAQAQTTIKGVVVDSLTNEGEPYATIRISKQNQEDKPVTMAVTDLEGKFAPVVKGNGKYTITFSSVGRATIKRNFTISGEKEIDLGTLLAHNEETMLKGIEVVAQKHIVKMEADKMTYSVKDD